MESSAVNGEPRLFHKRSREGKRGYPAWPTLQDVGDTMESALTCARLAADPKQRSWISPNVTARCTALPPYLIKRRVEAALRGDEAAWPWTRVHSDGGSPQVFLPELLDYAQYVYPRDLSHYIGRSPQALDGAVRRGEVWAAQTAFRTTWGGGSVISLPEALEYAHDIKLHGLFAAYTGTKLSRMRLMICLSNVAIARLRLTPGWTKIITRGEDLAR